MVTSDENRWITYSPALTLVPTYECFNRCAYCNFRVEPGSDSWLSIAAATQSLEWAKSQGVIEILILSGEVHPQSKQRKQWIQRIYEIGALALRLGFLPHTNVGPLSVAEMTLLKTVNVSMGLMLEQVTPVLMQGVHRHAPSKLPALRLAQLEQAGELKIPFTTGLLIGIGESEHDRKDSLGAIAAIHRQWGHIQEVILQPHQPGHQQLEKLPVVPAQELVNLVAIARETLPSDITIQVPPNLLREVHGLRWAIVEGARDLGGLGPTDEVNPDYPHPHPMQLQQLLKEWGWQLMPRLPIYPQYDLWLSSELHQVVKMHRERIVSLKTVPGQDGFSGERQR
jgi:FO synthase subunit 1